MFDSRGGVVVGGEGAYYDRLAVLAEMPSEAELLGAGEEPTPPWGDCEEAFDTWLDALVAADPETPRDPAVVIAAGETAPVTAALIGDLVGIDATSLDADGQVGLAVAWARVQNYATSRKVTAVASFAGPAPTGRDETTAHAWADIAAGLRLGDWDAAHLVDTTRTLHTRLPGTLAAMATGELSWRKAETLASATLALTPAQCRTVEARVLPKAVGRTPAQHAAAVRRAVDRIDPAGAAERRRKAKADIQLIRRHSGDGMGLLFATMPSEDLDTVWLASEAWGRRQKAAGDPRDLHALRVGALIDWAQTFLATGTSTSGTSTSDGAGNLPVAVDPDTGEPATHTLDRATGELVPVTPTALVTRPTQHGRPLTVNLIWDATAMAGVTDEPGEIVGTGALIPAETMRELIGFAEIRQMLLDPTTGHLLDLSPHTYRPSAALAEYVAVRDGTPTTPTGAPTPAGSGDLDHLIDHADGGPTTRTNLHSPTRRWHRLKTTGGFTVTRNPDGSITWTSTKTGRHYTVEPRDYRNDP